jgi:hypothetical protein
MMEYNGMTIPYEGGSANGTSLFDGRRFRYHITMGEPLLPDYGQGSVFVERYVNGIGHYDHFFQSPTSIPYWNQNTIDNTPLVVDEILIPVPTWCTYQRMSDDRRKFAIKADRPYFKDCFHIKTELWCDGKSIEPTLIDFREDADGWERTIAKVTGPLCVVAMDTLMRYHGPLSGVWLPEHHYRPDAAEMEGALRYALDSMRPKDSDATQGVQLPVFLLELVDAKRTYASLRTMTGSIKRLLTAGYKDFKSFNRAVALSTAEMQLSWSYAIAPFIADLSKLHQGLSHMKEYIDKWNQDAGTQTWRTRHFDVTPLVSNPYNQTTVVEDTMWTEGVARPSIDLYLHYGIERSIRDQVLITATYAYKPMSVDMSSMSMLMHKFNALGMGGGISLVWEMIPFSFLIDYLVSVGKFLRQFSVEGDLPIGDSWFGYSIKNTRTVTARAYYPVVNSSAFAYGTIKSYERVRCVLPDNYAEQVRGAYAQALRSQTFDLRKFKNVSALITAILLRKGKRR